MFGINKFKKSKRQEVTAFIGPSSTITSSKYNFSGAIRIDGTVKIDIEGNSENDTVLILGSSGKIEGNIRVKDAIIWGTVVGNVYASGLIDLSQDAKVEGSIEYSEIKKHDNAVVTGSSNKIN